jgi:SAM-dependent methyltransferase
MLLKLLEYLVCPACLPAQSPLELGSDAVLDAGDDIISAELRCGACGASYAVEKGLAVILPPNVSVPAPQAKYDSDTVLGSYLWSSFADVMQEEGACEAYARWAEMMPREKLSVVDAGCAVGRSTLEAAVSCGFAVGFDLSASFMTAARSLHREGRITCALKEQGRLTRPFTVELPERLLNAQADFIVADAMAMPFRSNAFGCALSLNVVDKLPQPSAHIRELSRVLQAEDATLILADPFSWSEEIAPPQEWLGGLADGPMAGRSEEVLPRLLQEGDGMVCNGFTVQAPQEVAWSIRNHANHRETITSISFKATR